MNQVPSHDGLPLIFDAMKAEIAAAEQRGAERIMRLSTEMFAELSSNYRSIKPSIPIEIAVAPHGLKKDGKPAKRRGRPIGWKNTKGVNRK